VAQAFPQLPQLVTVRMSVQIAPQQLLVAPPHWFVQLPQ
jgi:hypothetical protein